MGPMTDTCVHLLNLARPLAIAGRPVSLGELSGPGVELLRTRLHRA